MIINATDIKKKYKNYVLNKVNLEAQKGDIIGVTGANGSGKTTLLSIMAGVLKADGGILCYDGENVFKTGNFKKYVGYVPQENPLIEELSVNDNLKLWLGKDYDKSVVADLGVYEYLSKRVSKLSGGMKRRVSLAIALCQKPVILILDEPGAALDIYGKAEIRNYILNYVKNGGTVVMSTHDKEEISLCNKIYTMDKGELKNYESQKN